MSVGARAAAAAQAMVGCRFRAQGHDPITGLDCAGLVVAAYRAAGVVGDLPRDYPLRGWSDDRIIRKVCGFGFTPHADGGLPGDVHGYAFAAGQWHFAMAVGEGVIVHAHAGLRRVVASPMDAFGTPQLCWRWTGKG